jgi:RHS repeat-associated protein
MYIRFFPVNYDANAAYFDNLGFTYNNGSSMLQPELLSMTDYYPHGGVMPGQNYSNSFDYKFGYQGQYAEMDKESNESFFELRNYDAQIARFKTIDPNDQYHSPYLAMGNSHPNALDPDGGFSISGMFIGAAAGAAVGVGIDLINRKNMSGEAMVATVGAGMALGALSGGYYKEIGKAMSQIDFEGFFYYTERIAKDVGPVTSKATYFLWASRGRKEESYGHMSRVLSGGSTGATVSFDAQVNPDQIKFYDNRTKGLVYNSGTPNLSNGLLGDNMFSIGPATKDDGVFIINMVSGDPKGKIRGRTSLYSLTKYTPSQRITTSTTKFLWGFIPFSFKVSYSNTNLSKGVGSPGTTVKINKHMKFK